MVKIIKSVYLSEIEEVFVCIIPIYSLLTLLLELYYLKECTNKKFLLFFCLTLPKIV